MAKFPRCAVETCGGSIGAWNRKLGDCSIASTTTRAPSKNSPVRRACCSNSCWNLPISAAASGRRNAFLPNSRTNLARHSSSFAKPYSQGIKPWESPPRKALRAKLLSAFTVSLGEDRRDPLAFHLVLESANEVLGRGTDWRGRSDRPASPRPCCCTACASDAARAPRCLTATLGCSVPPGGGSCFRRAKCSTQARRAASSSLPLGIRSPPVCARRLVGFWKRSDCSGWSESTRAASRNPKRPISAAAAPLSGNCSRVPEPTPLSAWQMRHCAFSRTG